MNKIEIVDDIALKFNVPDKIANEILNKIPKSRQHPDGDIMVYWGYEECLWINYYLDQNGPAPNLPTTVPSPILRDYKWPGMMTPFEHQKATASFLSTRMRAFCFNEAGTGKTVSALWAADYLMGLGLVKRILIVCPLSIIYTAWQSDVVKTIMHRSCGVAYGDRDKRVSVVSGPYEIVVINYDGIGVVYDVIKEAGFDLVIIDEANAYKNTSTKRWKTLAKLINPSTRIWAMTGTPASQSPVDAFGLAKLVSPYRVPKFVTAWKDQVLYQISRFKYLPKADSVDKVYKALQPAIRFKKSECLDLPDLVYEVRDIPLTPQVTTYYNRLKKQMLIEAAGEEISAVNAAASLSKLLQISGGAVYSDNKNIVEFDVSPRLNVLQEVLDEASNKVVIFVPFLHTIQVITDFLTKHGHSNSVIKGDVSARERANIIGNFQQHPDPKILVIQPQAASHGITLTRADTIVFWSPVLSVETFIQCVGRIDRVGQVHKMLVVMLQGSDAERRVYDMLQGKIKSHGQLTELYKQVIE